MIAAARLPDGRRGWRASLGLVVLAASVLAGCASLNRQPPARDGTDEAPLSGRLAVKVEGNEPKSVSAAFDLQGNAKAGSLALSTPLGSMLAQARWNPGHVTLTTPKGSSDYADLDGLTRDVLGESIPVAALFDWLRGRPWPSAPSTPIVGGPGFEQLGWKVDLNRFGEGFVDAARSTPPAVTVRVRLD